MRLLKHRSMVFYLGFVLILSMAIGGVAIGAFASTCTASGSPASCSINTGVTATVASGGLNLVDNNTSIPLGSFTLNGKDQFPTYNLPLTVQDFTGSGAGWNLSIKSTAFTNSITTLSQSIASGSATATTCPGGSTCTYTAPTNSASSSVTIPTSGSPSVFFNAALNTGMGSFDLTPTVTVSIPANATSGNYSTTVTVTLASGP